MNSRMMALMLIALAAGAAHAAEPAPSPSPERRWELNLSNFFRDRTKPLVLYARERNGEWIAAVGSSRDAGRDRGKTYNRSWYCGELASAPIRDGRMKGPLTVHLTPDPWVPKDHQSVRLDFEVDAALAAPDRLEGTYTLVKVHSTDPSVQNLGQKGSFGGTAAVKPNKPLPEPVTFRFDLHGALIGGDPRAGDRCLVLRLGVEAGKLVAAAHGKYDTGPRMYGSLLEVEPFKIEGCSISHDSDRVRAHIVVAARTMDAMPCMYTVDLQGWRLDGLLVGTYSLKAAVEGQPEVVVAGSFEGSVGAGVERLELKGPEKPLFTDVPGFVRPAPGEHPRLLFRKADVPALRKKAETPEGKALVARLRAVLGGNGEVFPTVFCASTKGYDRDAVQPKDLERPGAFTIGHAAGYGLLYQLTGEKKYADLGRQAFEKMLEGVRDVDDRYSFVAPNGELRSGSSWAWAALGYDLCYDGWDAEFRRKAAQAFLAVEIEQKEANLKKVVTAPKCSPAKNHFGGIICGATAAAAIAGDPGTEGEDIWGQWMPAAYEQTRRMLTGGFGDHGFYSEGHGPSSVSSNTGLLMWLQTAKVACGKDFISAAPNGQWITLRLAMETVPVNGVAQWMDRKSNAGASYGTATLWRSRGQFAQGFGAIEDKYKPALLWTYRSFVEAPELKGVFPESKSRNFIAEGWLKAGERSYDALNRPWIAVLAFVNWPVGMEPENPAKVMPKAMEDRIHGYYVFRNQWKDENDILISALLGYGPKDAYVPQHGPVYLWGLGQKYSFGVFKSDGPAEFAPGPNGGVVSAGAQCLAVDFSGVCGAPALLALAGIEGPESDGTVKVTSLDLAGRKINVLTMQANKAPEVKVEAGKITVGGQTIAWDGKKFVFGK
jgi:hypothetical protein